MKARPRAGDRRSEDEIGRELLRLAEMRRAHPRAGAHFHIAIGMEWALKWASHRGQSPTSTLEALTETDNARLLAEAYDELQRAIDAFVREQGGRLFGLESPQEGA